MVVSPKFCSGWRPLDGTAYNMEARFPKLGNKELKTEASLLQPFIILEVTNHHFCCWSHRLNLVQCRRVLHKGVNTKMQSLLGTLDDISTYLFIYRYIDYLLLHIEMYVFPFIYKYQFRACKRCRSWYMVNNPCFRSTFQRAIPTEWGWTGRQTDFPRSAAWLLLGLAKQNLNME